MKESILRTRSFDFAIDSIYQYKKLCSKREFILSKQFLRSSTSIGANIREANNAESIADFIHKLNISQKECDETLYWLELMHKTDFISNQEFNHLHGNATELFKMLKSSIFTTKSKYGKFKP